MPYEDDHSASVAAVRSGDRGLEATFEGRSRELARARDTVRVALTAWGYDADEAERVALAAGELLTNAIVHGQGEVGLSMAFDGEEARIEVSDHGDGRPAVRPADPTGRELGGWGLRIVDQIAHDWGTHRDDGRTVVWMTHRR